MIIAVTGQPKTGKSTFIRKVIDKLDGSVPLRGFLTEEIRVSGVRTGFAMVDSASNKTLIAQSSHSTADKVGRFFVEVGAIDEFIKTVPRPSQDGIYYADEIGQMQLLSPQFRTFIAESLSAKCDLLLSCSSVFEDSLIDHIKAMPEVFLFELTQDNRAACTRQALMLFESLQYYRQMTAAQKEMVKSFFDKYRASHMDVAIEKLFGKAMRYVVEHRVNRSSKYTFDIIGDHSTHRVELLGDGAWSCDCELSNGREPYLSSSECSHYQACLLFDEYSFADTSVF